MHRKALRLCELTPVYSQPRPVTVRMHPDSRIIPYWCYHRQTYRYIPTISYTHVHFCSFALLYTSNLVLFNLIVCQSFTVAIGRCVSAFDVSLIYAVSNVILFFLSHLRIHAIPSPTICPSAPRLPCFSSSLLLCSPFCLLHWYSAFMLSCFPTPLLFCSPALFYLCFFVFLLLCSSSPSRTFLSLSLCSFLSNFFYIYMLLHFRFLVLMRLISSKLSSFRTHPTLHFDLSTLMRTWVITFLCLTQQTLTFSRFRFMVYCTRALDLLESFYH